MNDLERRVHTAIKECYDVVIAPTYGLGSALAAVFMKIHGRAPHRRLLEQIIMQWNCQKDENGSMQNLKERLNLFPEVNL